MLGGFAIDWWQVLVNLGHVAAAYALTLPLAWDREKASVSVGLRTFPLVAVASCGFVLTGAQITGGNPESLARVIQGLMTGIGFIGGGAILKKDGTVEGVATAVSIWNTGAIGASAALGRYEIAIVLSLVNFLTLRLLTPLKKRLHDESGEGE
jgi:putative Mg2+ transporter-C (MgtC) family protein